MCCGAVMMPGAPGRVNVAMPAPIIVSLTADAWLTVDGAVTKSTAERRVFTTPEIDPNATYVYTLRAEFTQNGKTISESREVIGRAKSPMSSSLFQPRP